MAYRIDYRKKPKLRKDFLTLFLALIYLLLGFAVRKVSSGPAFLNLSGNLKQGAPIGESIETFCREVFLEIS